MVTVNHHHKVRHLLLMGPPGAGKGTQANLLKARLSSVAHLATGDLMRTAVQNQTITGQKIAVYLDGGRLVPDGLVCEMVMEHLRTVRADWIIWDGFPRSTAQMTWLNHYVTDHVQVIVAVVWLAINRHQINQRLAARLTCLGCGKTTQSDGIAIHESCRRCQRPLIRRPDDQPITLATRMTEYELSTVSLRQHYRRVGLLRVLDATLPPSQLAAEIAQFCGLSD